MQPASTEVPQQNSVEFLTLNPSTSAQHGLQHGPEYASSSPATGEAERESTQSFTDADAFSVSSGESGRGREVQGGRLSGSERSSLNGSPGSRIDEYEKLNTRSQRRNAASTYREKPPIRRVSYDGGRVLFDRFPNGRLFRRPSFSRLTVV